MWSLSHTCHVGNQVSSPNQTKKVKKLIKPSNAHLPTSCFSISHSWLLLKEQHASLCVFVAGKKVTDPFLDLQNSRQALASKKAILASHHFSTGVEDSKGSKKTQPPKHPQRCRERQGCRSFAAFYPFFLLLSFRTKEPIWTQPHWSVPWDHQDEMPSPPSSPCPCKHGWPWGLWCIVMTTYGTLNDPPFRGFAC